MNTHSDMAITSGSTTNKKLVLHITRDDLRIAWLAAFAICIHILESSLPSPIPGIKPGLANIVTIVVLLKYGWGSAAWVSLLRVLGSSLITGTFLSPTFLLSSTGMLATLLVLWTANQLSVLRPGAIGFSVLAALAHMSGQFLLAYLVFIPHPGMLNLFPVLMSVALVLGIVNGIISQKLFTRIA